MVVVVGHEEGMDPQPWLGKLLSVEKGVVTIHWYRQRRSKETKLGGYFWPLYQVSNPKLPDCGHVKMENDIFLDWGFDMVEQNTGWKIPLNRVEPILTGFESFEDAGPSNNSKRERKRQPQKKKNRWK